MAADLGRERDGPCLGGAASGAADGGARRRLSGLDGVASIDGKIEPEEVAEACLRAIAAEDFLILPHPEVLEYMRNKTANYGRWIGGMRKLARRFTG